MRRLHLAYIWHSDHAAWASQIELLRPKDLIVFNPSTGPAPDDKTELDMTLRHIRSARGRGAVPFGYVDYGYGERPIGDVLIDIHAWWAEYRVDRIFFDRMLAPFESIPHTLTSLRYACYLAKPDEDVCIFNFGVRPAAFVAPRQSLVVSYEGPASTSPHPSHYSPWEIVIRYGADGPLEPGPETQAWTSDTMPNPYDGRRS